MRLPDTLEMKQIWDEIAPFLKITSKGMEIVENAPSNTAEKLEEYRRLGK